MNSIAELEFPGKYLSEEFLRRIDGDFEEDLRRETVIALKKLIETSLEGQVQDLIGSPHWAHNPNRPTYRNGYYNRGLFTSFGYISSLEVPRIRSGYIDYKIFKRYQRRSKSIDSLIMNMFLMGVSTRSIEEVLKPLYGKKSVSAGLVSKVTKVLDEQVRRFHTRRLVDRYEYLILDGIYINAKSPVYKRRRCVLVAYGIWTIKDESGKVKIKKELIDYELAPKGESEQAWMKFLNGLYYRGLEGKKLKLIVTDGNKGLKNAISMIYPNALVQLCWFHKIQNISSKLSPKIKEECIKEVKEIYKQESYNRAVNIYKNWVKKWELVVPKAVQCLDKDIEELLNFFKCPKELWKKIRTTNAIERSFKEIRRRTKTMSCFQNTSSLERIIYAIFNKMNNKWENISPILESSLFYEITQNY